MDSTALEGDAYRVADFGAIPCGRRAREFAEQVERLQSR